MIDYNALYNKFVGIAQQQVGTYLSKSGPDGTEPNVIRLRPNAPQPDYPYITVDIQDTSEESAWQTNEYINADNHTVHEVIKTLMINYRCYGGKSSTDNDGLAINIMNQLHSSFMFHTVRDDLRGNLGASITRTNEIDSTPIQLRNTYLESAAFSLLINIVDSQVDTNSSVIDTVDLTGDVYSLQGDIDADQVSITINNQP